MIKIDIGPGEDAKKYMVSVSGTLEEISADTLCTINGIYLAVYDEDKEMAALLRAMITAAVTDDEARLWDTGRKRTGVGMVIPVAKPDEEVQP